MNVELYADPSCPWSWAAYRWLEAVAPHRQLRILLRPFSLVLRDGPSTLSGPRRNARELAHRVLRIAVAIQDETARCEFYAAVTGSLYASVAAGRPPVIDLGAALDASGADPGLTVCADDERLDDDIRTSMAALQTVLPLTEATSHTIPVLVLDAATGRVACHGPLLDPAPHGRIALRLWDALEALLQMDGVYQISRPRPARHSLLAGSPT